MQISCTSEPRSKLSPFALHKKQKKWKNHLLRCFSNNWGVRRRRRQEQDEISPIPILQTGPFLILTVVINSSNREGVKSIEELKAKVLPPTQTAFKKAQPLETDNKESSSSAAQKQKQPAAAAKATSSSTSTGAPGSGNPVSLLQWPNFNCTLTSPSPRTH